MPAGTSNRRVRCDVLTYLRAANVNIAPMAIGPPATNV